MVTTNELSTPLSLVQFMLILQTVPNVNVNARELVGTGDNSNATFWLDNIGVIESTYTLSYGATEASLTTLTETTHYTIDLDTSKITLTAAGITAVGTNNIYGEYSYNTLNFRNSELLAALNPAENKLLRSTDQTFVDSSVSNPGYRQVNDELLKGHFNPLDKVYDFYYSPLVKIQTTVNGAFTLGETTLTLTDASLLPNAATIYVGGNKVAYTAKSGNDLTVPNTTPSIADGATVRGEVIELSIQPEGTDPSYTVLDPDTEYEVDYDNGRFKILSNAYFGEIAVGDRIHPSNHLVRVNYMQAWHEPGRDPEIPDEIQWVVNSMAARKLMGSAISRAHSAGLNDFNPRLIEVDKEAIQEVIDEYSVLNVGTSFYNKQSLS